MFVGKMEGALQVGAIQAHEDWSPSCIRMADHLERAIAKQRVGPVNLQELPCDAVLDELDGAVIPKAPDVIDARRGHRDKLRLYVQRRVLRLAYRCNRSRKACCRGMFVRTTAIVAAMAALPRAAAGDGPI